MANHKSSIKRIRSNKTKQVRNKYQAKTTRNVIKDIRMSKDKKEAEKSLPGIHAMLDKLAKTNVIHKSKASNLKSKLTRHVNGMK